MSREEAIEMFGAESQSLRAIRQRQSATPLPIGSLRDLLTDMPSDNEG
jgi:hypothetical protein